MKAVARLCCSAIAVLLLSSLALSQSLTTGAINGTILDSSGAAISGAIIVATNTNTGAKRTTTSGDTGLFVLAQLDPGEYTVTAQARGFKTGQSGAVTVSVSRIASFHFRLQVGAISEKVEVSTQVPLIEPSNPNTTTTFDAKQLSDLPNPGMDLSYVAALVPGALLNTVSNQQGSTGNVEVSGLPSIANDFTIDGLDANEPVLNTNSTGASGLQLGLNAIQEVSVNTQGYSVDQGRFGGAVVNYVTKSGGNAYHGNVYELWNGSALNATNFFIKANPEGPPKPRTNTNLFGASIGGPIKKDRLFFFADLEGVRLIVADILTSVLPTPAYQSYVLQQLPLGGTDSVYGTVLPPQPGEVPLYQRMFALMGDTSRGTSFGPVLGCPFDVGGGTPVVPGSGDGCANLRLFSTSPVNSETLFTLKLDYHGNTKDSYWFRFQLNNGTARQADAVNSLFDTVAPAELRSGSAGWTHVFSRDLVNQFNPGIAYQSIIRNVPNPSEALAAMPITYASPPFSTVGGSLYIDPAGAATTTWQINDNLAWTRGRHNFKFGVNMRRPLLTDFHNIFVVPLVTDYDLPEFAFGSAGLSEQAFPKSTEDRVAAVNMDLYAMDALKAARRLTVTYGLRAVWDSDPVSRHDDFARFRGSFETIPHNLNRPPNQDILSGQEKLYASTPLVQWQPRVALAYEARSNTLLTAGFGFFGDPLPLLSGVEQADNPPSMPEFFGGVFGQVGGMAAFPGVPNNVVTAAVAANQQFQSAFSSGALSCASPQASSNCVPVLPFTDISGPQRYPYIMQWGSSIQHEVGKSFGLVARYVGTRTVSTFYSTQPNLFQTACQGCFASIPFNTPPDGRFSEVSSFHAGANSTYNALVATGEKRMSHGLAFQVNYTYSHCIDYQSNGGQIAFNDNYGPAVPLSGIRGLRGNCDYDVRHSVNANYIYELPFNSRQPWVAQIVHGWQVAGTVFVRGGLPFSVQSAPDYIDFPYGSPGLFANLVPGQSRYSRSNVPGTQPGTIQWLNPSAFQSVIDPNTYSCFPATPQLCTSGTLGRNTLRAPDFRWADLTITKRFKINDKAGLRVDTQLFNVFNHPNFAIPNPATSLSAGLTGFGEISSSVSPLTGLLGSGLGGDTSIRMIALQARIEF